ncbi:uncharacterized protein LOC107045433 [Diachasma alloeum]|nr:uncharacterized protein LOC107045433 [Diachasma alloeum]
MKLDPPTFRLLVINLCLVISITTGELEYYQDVDSEPSETDVRLKELERFLVTQSRLRLLRRDQAPSSYRHLQAYKDDTYRAREREILEALVDNPSIMELVEKNQENNINPHSDYNSIAYPRSLNRHPYINVNLEPSGIYQYPKVKIPYPDHRINDNIFFDNSPRYPLKLTSPNKNDNYETEIDRIDNSLEKLHNKLYAFNGQRHDNALDKEVPPLDDQVPDFTYHFGEPKSEELENTFATKPNDPRYWEKMEHVTRREEHPKIVVAMGEMIKEPIENRVMKIEDMPIDSKPALVVYKSISSGDKQVGERNDRLVEIMPEPQRRAEKEPIITFTRNKVNNDVYFIAIVAGCSAAAMFTLVLISLTWCRLQRGVKAAADIEYPAYGVTGPNKDVSPSGDQRLAHSAQMYHFQHQKQQIIAMEKSAASRDPGSVSEAESDEENEEGDYTVYECPGLAPAGEVEVKNPMFHDDPTPATPSQNTKDEEPHH